MLREIHSHRRHIGYICHMDDPDFDRALVAAFFDLAGSIGWRRVTIVAAARAGGLDLSRARARFPGRCAVLLRFGSLADQAALAGIGDAPPRDLLFDIVMRRIDVLQTHRAGVAALLKALPFDPPAALLLAATSLRSMGWLLDGAGIDTFGAVGRLRAKGMLAVWAWTVRAWQGDTSEDLSATMAALDQALDRAEQAEATFARPKRSLSPESSAAPPQEGA